MGLYLYMLVYVHLYRPCQHSITVTTHCNDTFVAEESFVYLLTPSFLELLELILLGGRSLRDLLHAGVAGTPPLFAGVHQHLQLLLGDAGFVGGVFVPHAEGYGGRALGGRGDGFLWGGASGDAWGVDAPHVWRRTAFHIWSYLE